MRPPPSAARHEGVFTYAEARAAGWTPPALRHAVRTRSLRRLRSGVYALPPPSGPDHDLAVVTQEAIAVSAVVRDAHVSHVAAARLCRWPVWVPRLRPCVTVPPGPTSTVAQVHLHRSALNDGDQARRGSVAMTSPARTVVDIAREFGSEAGLVVADAGLRSGLLLPDRLTDAVVRGRGRPGIAQMTPVLAHATALSESVLESRSRWRIVAAGLPEPELQAVILDSTGRFVARVDFLWRAWGVVGEADGRGKYDGPRALYEEKRREDELRALGLGVVRWGWPDLEPFAPTAGRIRRASAEPRSARMWVSVT